MSINQLQKQPVRTGKLLTFMSESLFWRERAIYAAALLVVLILGLGSRSYLGDWHLPAFVESHAGDVLWAALIYLGYRFLFIKRSKTEAFIVSLGFSYAIEVSQLYKAPWINDLRHTLFGALVLGRGFLWIDLVRYLAGIVIGYVVDSYLLNKTNKHKL